MGAVPRSESARDLDRLVAAPISNPIFGDRESEFLVSGPVTSSFSAAP